MAFQTPITIKDVLEKIESKQYVLPAIQREFVWGRDQICGLFDSLMRKYPIGSFLFWSVSAERSLDFRFYEFLTSFHERDLRHNPVLPRSERDLTAILDGQQRLSSLSIGLLGSHTEKLPRLWANNPDAFPKCFLYCDLTHEGAVDEPGMLYRFEFLEPERAKRESSEEGTAVHWYRVGDVVHAENGYPLLDSLQKAGLDGDRLNSAFQTLDRLWTMVHTDLVISYHEEKAQDIDRVLDIFIRVNSGGTKLSHSDLLLSIATAQWEDLDARESVNALVDEMNQRTGQGFSFSKDLVLKAALVLTDIPSIRFQVKSFTHENMARIESGWDEINRALLLAAKLLARFGYSGRTLVADSVLIPIADYLHMRGVDASYLTSQSEADDRERVRQWVLRSLLKAGVWGSGLDSTLTEIRKVLRESGRASFPISELETALAKQGKSLRFDQEEIDELADMQYGNPRLFTVLAALYPGVDVGYSFHIDHVFPKSKLTKAKLLSQGVPEEVVVQIQAQINSLANLQLLEGPINEAKQATVPSEWVAERFGGPESPQLRQYLAVNDLAELPSSAEEFLAFVDARRARMRSRLTEMLISGRAGGEPVDAAGKAGTTQ